jgi:hypothetical protein
VHPESLWSLDEHVDGDDPWVGRHRLNRTSRLRRKSSATSKISGPLPFTESSCLFARGLRKHAPAAVGHYLVTPLSHRTPSVSSVAQPDGKGLATAACHCSRAE